MHSSLSDAKHRPMSMSTWGLYAGTSSCGRTMPRSISTRRNVASTGRGRSLRRIWARTLPTAPADTSGHVELLAWPGEPLVEVGQEWSKRTGSDRAFVIGLANARHRYLPLMRHFEMSDASVQYDTVTAGLEPTAVDRLVDEAESMHAAIRGGPGTGDG